MVSSVFSRRSFSSPNDSSSLRTGTRIDISVLFSILTCKDDIAFSFIPNAFLRWEKRSEPICVAVFVLDDHYYTIFHGRQFGRILQNVNRLSRVVNEGRGI